MMTDPSQHYYYQAQPPKPPAFVVAIVTFLLGPIGAIAAWGLAKQAKELGYPTNPYWGAFIVVFFVVWLPLSMFVLSLAFR